MGKREWIGLGRGEEMKEWEGWRGEWGYVMREEEVGRNGKEGVGEERE